MILNGFSFQTQIYESGISSFHEEKKPCLKIMGTFHLESSFVANQKVEFVLLISSTDRMSLRSCDLHSKYWSLLGLTSDYCQKFKFLQSAWLFSLWVDSKDYLMNKACSHFKTLGLIAFPFFAFRCSSKYLVEP